MSSISFTHRSAPIIFIVRNIYEWFNYTSSKCNINIYSSLLTRAIRMLRRKWTRFTSSLHSHFLVAGTIDFGPRGKHTHSHTHTGQPPATANGIAAHITNKETTTKTYEICCHLNNLSNIWVTLKEYNMQTIDLAKSACVVSVSK